MAERDPLEGRKGGSMEGALPHYYEPTVTAVTDMVVPATRVQWGPVIAGVIVALATAFLFISLGVGLGISTYGMIYWSIAFGAIGLFLGSYLAARTAKADRLPAIEHAIVVWGIVLLTNTLALLGALRVIGLHSLSGAASAAGVGTPAGAGAIGYTAMFGWPFFIGFLIMLAASIFGAIVGMVPHEEHVEHAEHHV